MIAIMVVIFITIYAFFLYQSVCKQYKYRDKNISDLYEMLELPVPPYSENNKNREYSNSLNKFGYGIIILLGLLAVAALLITNVNGI
jgi:hypothetical protein